MYNNLRTIADRISLLAESSPLAVTKPTLIAVSKNQPFQKVSGLLMAGHNRFGENRYQEAKERWEEVKKVEAYRHLPLELHFIGALQTNKVQEVVSFFDYIHSLDRPKLADALARAMKDQGRSLPCFIQVNTGEEPQKAGIIPKEAPGFITYCRDELKLPIIGLMCIPPAGLNPAPHFAFLRQLAQEHNLLRLSMGMSADWETALRLGATDIRLGTALFGER